jgi:hypothetical protein
MENCKNVPKTAEQRKKETEQLLKSLDIPYFEHLPLNSRNSKFGK